MLWLNLAGPKGRFRSRLINQIVAGMRSHDDECRRIVLNANDYMQQIDLSRPISKRMGRALLHHAAQGWRRVQDVIQLVDSGTEATRTDVEGSAGQIRSRGCVCVLMICDTRSHRSMPDSALSAEGPVLSHRGMPGMPCGSRA